MKCDRDEGDPEPGRGAKALHPAGSIWYTLSADDRLELAQVGVRRACSGRCLSAQEAKLSL